MKRKQLKLQITWFGKMQWHMRHYYCVTNWKMHENIEIPEDVACLI